MIAATTISTRSAQDSELQFYSNYEWCLNPYLTVRELFQRLREELDRYSSLQQEWQKEESIINLYLFVCAIGCAVDDFLSARQWRLGRLGDRFPRWSLMFSIVERILNSRSRMVNAFFRKRIVQWKRKWDRCVEQACVMLVENTAPRSERLVEFKKKIDALSNVVLPDTVLRRKMKIHEGYRCQDLTHFDVFSLVQKFVAQSNNQYSPVMIIGLRTAGAYFAPLAKAYLSSLGWPNVSWMSIRPKEGLSRWEKRALRRSQFRSSPVLVIDDYPNSGQTLLLASRILRAHRISPNRIVFLFPKHSFETEWSDKINKTVGSKIITLEHSELYKQKLMRLPAIEELALHYFHGERWDNISVKENMEIEAINLHLQLHYSEGFQVRLKRLYELHSGNNHSGSEARRIIAKSVGWGWLGYHAFIIAKRMRDFVPECIGLRNGFLFMEWIDISSKETTATVSPDVIASYLIARAKRLRLKEDPRSGNPDYGWGWLEILGIVRRAYGNYLGRLIDKKLLPDIHARLRCAPAVIDGKLSPSEWLQDGKNVFKIDFEHHGFGAPELDVVDAAYDIAGAIFEFQMPGNTEEEFIQSYVKGSGDDSVRDRLLLYKLLYGTMAMRKAVESAQRLHLHQYNEAGNERATYARTFLANTMNHFAAGLLQNSVGRQWTKKLFFLDLDGVYDTEVLGFPHTTISGVQAVACLQRDGWSIVLNTGRSIHHVKSYCTTYNFQGGIAEYGSVFFDSAQGHEIPLIDNDGEKQLHRCREAIRALPGVFIDSEYRYSIRVYRYSGRRTSGLSVEETKNLLVQHNLHKLTFIARSEDTYIVQKNCSKGRGVRFVREYLHSSDETTAAIGDSDEDISMLEETEFSYAPRNCSDEVRRKAASEGWKILRKPHQKGLLEAAQECTRRTESIQKSEFLRVPHPTQKVAQLIFRIAGIAELSMLMKIFMMINY